MRNSNEKRDLPIPHEQGKCAPPSQARPDASEGELSDDSNLPSRKCCRLRSPQGEADSHQQELDPSYMEILNAIRGLLDLEVPQVECLVAPSAFSKKPSKQVVRKQNLFYLLFRTLGTCGMIVLGRRRDYFEGQI